MSSSIRLQMGCLSPTIALVSVASIMLLCVPYTKVEESFPLHATYDLLANGTRLFHTPSLVSTFDHISFPGVVPRTFLGSLLLALAVVPLQGLSSCFGLTSGFVSVALVRWVLGVFVCGACGIVWNAVAKRWGIRTAGIGIALTLSQFHFLFYATRTLPNTFALVSVLLGLSFWIRDRIGSALFLFCFTAAVFRFELIAFIIPFVIVRILRSPRLFFSLFVIGSLAVALGAGVSVLVDSFFWKRFVWPEFEVLWFNTVENRSSEWGTMPFFWYFLVALPKSLYFAFPIGVIWGVMSSRVREQVLIALSFVTLYSILPHKELRFIIYVLPILTIAAADALSNLWSSVESCSNRSVIVSGLFRIALIVIVAASCLVTCGFLASSRVNYPGAQALNKIASLAARDRRVIYTHCDETALMSGISRFLHDSSESLIRVNKTEGLVPADLDAFDALIDASLHPSRAFVVTDAAYEFDGIDLTKMYSPSLKIRPSVFVHHRVSSMVSHDMNFRQALVSWSQSQKRIRLVLDELVESMDNVGAGYFSNLVQIGGLSSKKADPFRIDLELLEPISKMECKAIGGKIRCDLFKSKCGIWNRLLKEPGQNPPWLRIDWTSYDSLRKMDEDQSNTQSSPISCESLRNGGSVLKFELWDYLYKEWQLQVYLFTVFCMGMWSISLAANDRNVIGFKKMTGKEE